MTAFILTKFTNDPAAGKGFSSQYFLFLSHSIAKE